MHTTPAYIQAKFQQGEKEIKQGKGIRHNDVKRRLLKIVKKLGLFVCFILSTQIAFATALIKLKVGSLIEGNLIERGEDYIKVKPLEGEPITYSLDQVENADDLKTAMATETQLKNQDIQKKYYDNSTLQSETTYADGQIHGTKREYYPNGNLNMVTHFTHGVMDGLLQKYNEDGTLDHEHVYRNSRPDGIYQKVFKYFDNGTLKNEILFNMGNGYKKEYYDNG